LVVGCPEEVGVRGKLGGEAIGRQGRSVDLDEALLDEDPVAFEAEIGHDRVGAKDMPASTAAGIEGMNYFVSPGEWPELVSFLTGSFSEPDHRVVDGQGVLLKLACDLFGIERRRYLRGKPGVLRGSCP